MEMRRAGSSGLTVSRLGLGTMTWGRDTDEHEAADQCRAFLDAGGNFLDTAAMYADGDSERVIGGLIGALFRREDVVIATKGGVMGSAVGGGTGRTLAVLGGAILGALAGDAVEDRVGKKDGFEITVRLDNGETRVIAQEADVPLVLNQRVQVVSGAGPTRVTPMSGQ